MGSATALGPLRRSAHLPLNTRMKLILALLLLTSSAFAQGVLYRYELHDTDIGVKGFKGRLDMPIHRIGVVDTGGVMAAAFEVMGSARYLGGHDNMDGTRTEYWTARPVAPRPGIDGRLEFAWNGDTSLDGSTSKSDIDYFEWRVVLGGGDLVDDAYYYSVDILDITGRSVTGSTGSSSFGNDQISVNVGLEMGLVFAPAFLGGFAAYDWFGGLQKLIALGDDDVEDHTYQYGLVAGLGFGALRVDARYGWYQWSDLESLSLEKRTMMGQLLSFGASLIIPGG